MWARKNREDEKYFWTRHVREKMRYYRLTESRIKRIIRHPVRIEEGILENAIACMQRVEGKKYSEIWVMYLIAPRGGSLPAGQAGLGSHQFQTRSFASSGSLAKSRKKFSPYGEPSKLRPPLSRKRSTSAAFDPTDGLKKLKIITAWRYPGKSPERDPVPAEVLEAAKKLI